MLSGHGGRLTLKKHVLQVFMRCLEGIGIASRDCPMPIVRVLFLITQAPVNGIADDVNVNVVTKSSIGCTLHLRT